MQKMEIKANTEKFNLLDFETAIVDFGVIKKGKSEVLEVDFPGLMYKSNSRSCGCVNPEIIITNDGFKVVIKFKPKKDGINKQWIKVFYRSNGGEDLELKINLNCISN